MINAEERNQLLSIVNATSGHITSFDGSADRAEDRPQFPESASHGLFHLASELHRRRVCRAATLYAIAMWLICQIVELVYLELGLPDWTLKFVIVLGLVGFPIALILAWLFDITPEGVVADDGSNRTAATEAAPRGRLDRLIDCSLVLLALIIGGQLAFGALNPNSIEAPVPIQKIAIVSFRSAGGSEADALAQGLVAELQHEIVSNTSLTVIVPQKPFVTAGSVSLAGSIAVDEGSVRVTATLIDNDNGVVTWSNVIHRTKSDSLMMSAEIARDIVLALPLSLRVSRAAGEHHDS